MNIKELLNKFGISNKYQWLDNFELFDFKDIFTDMIRDNNTILFTGKTSKGDDVALLIDLKDKINFLNYNISGENFNHYEVYSINGLFMGRH